MSKQVTDESEMWIFFWHTLLTLEEEQEHSGQSLRLLFD